MDSSSPPSPSQEAGYWRPRHPNCPRLFLAPMEGLGDYFFRKSLAKLGGFDEACREFLRVPPNAHIKSLAKIYQSQEMAPFSLAAQIMGLDPQLMGAMAAELESRGAKRIDLNCGCPSNTVVGKGAGAGLLRNPEKIHRITRAMVLSVCASTDISVKMRSGYEDTSLFHENIKAIEEAGASFLTLHPRTKKQAYSHTANWDLIALAKSQLNIPVVGNGDILCFEDMQRMLNHTGCDGIMIGRGAAKSPWIFQEIHHKIQGSPCPDIHLCLKSFLDTFLTFCQSVLPPKQQINKLKQILHHLFSQAREQKVKKTLLRLHPSNPNEFKKNILKAHQTLFSPQKGDFSI